MKKDKKIEHLEAQLARAKAEAKEARAQAKKAKKELEAELKKKEKAQSLALQEWMQLLTKISNDTNTQDSQ